VRRKHRRSLGELKSCTYPTLRVLVRASAPWAVGAVDVASVTPGRAVAAAPSPAFVQSITRTGSPKPSCGPSSALTVPHLHNHCMQYDTESRDRRIFIVTGAASSYHCVELSASTLVRALSCRFAVRYRQADRVVPPEHVPHRKDLVRQKQRVLPLPQTRHACIYANTLSAQQLRCTLHLNNANTRSGFVAVACVSSHPVCLPPANAAQTTAPVPQMRACHWPRQPPRLRHQRIGRNVGERHQRVHDLPRAHR
jgi:hypothetical protein